ncbi:hypothetical protein CW704_02680 [Candidatus Bathyarchaeota archaeon]|nr:MAG: hypothetical protein CW704_02680 [Candidatus Bathyarchaeota archaeon]
MSFKEEKTVYFESPGEQNTDVLLSVVKRYVDEKNIRDIVVASTRGLTGVKASEILKGYNVVIVTHHTGFREPGKNELKDEYRRKILANGAKIFTGTHALSSVERAIRRRFGAVETLEIIANTLRLLGQGTKVCVEIVLMAADAGLISMDKDVVAVGGTGRGADTALLIKPANTSDFFNLKIKEIIAKPKEF